AEMDKVSDWMRPTGAYQSRDMDVTMKGIAEKRPETVKPGYIMRPRYPYMKNGLGIRTARNSRSPYWIKEIGESKYGLFEGDEKVEEVYFPGYKRWADEAFTSKGSPVTSLIAFDRHCFSFGATRFCEYFSRGEQCKFCNYNATQDDARSLGTSVPIHVDLDETVEAYKIFTSQTRVVEGRFEMGGFKDHDNEVKIHLNFVESMAKAAPYTPYFVINSQPMSRKNLERLRDAGISAITHQMEVWDPELFEEVCPGKARRDGHDGYKQGFLDAIDVFGVGNVAGLFVGGLNLMPDNGRQTWQEARDTMVEGYQWLATHGVIPCIFALRLGVGSVYGDNPASWDRLAPTEYYLDLALDHHQVMTENDLYAKFKLVLCPLDCFPAFYAGDIGFLANYGNIANWAEQRVPAGTNWLAGFIESVK
ncbi:MAG: hypothetical protein Q7O66_23555, partial [Dehalococcoidia bacterium]|nr:hypothetical protein [Dehalococcoidia bacterium]